MAACELKIELDEPNRPRVGGEPVSGTVVVTATSPVKCDGLEVTTYWSTHGRGNVDQGDVDQSVVFEGAWDPGREYRYPFSLKTADWPPTYYGTYLNVSHRVRAKARISWAKDPKAEAEFPVVATAAPEDLQPTVLKKQKSNAVIGWLIAGFLLVVFGALFTVLLAFIVPVLLVVGAIYWFFRVFLPKQLTGPIECSVTPQRIAAGEMLQGTLRFAPKRNLLINGIQWNVTCHEKCVSGTGSNRTNHRHELFTATERLAEPGTLRPGLPQEFDFSFAVPDRGPCSLKFPNNELIWSGELRIDIPKWPDWVQTFPLTVVPSTTLTMESAAVPAGAPETISAMSAGSSASGRAPTAEETAWFDEVVQQIIQSRHDRDRLDTVLAAVQQQVFVIRVDIDTPAREAPAQAAREPGKWMFAEYRAREFDLCLLWPAPAQPPMAGTSDWCGSAAIIGFDSDLDCLLMRVSPRS